MRCGVRGSNTIILVWAMRGGSGKVTTMVARSLLPEASHDTSVEAGAKEARIHPCKGRSLAWERKSGCRAKLDVDWRRRVDERAEFEPTVGQLDAEHGDVVGVLVCGVKKGSRGIDVHASGPLPACRLPADHFEFTRVRLDFEHCDAVVTAVRIVEEPPAGVDADLRGGLGAGKVGRQCRDGLLPDERSAHRII